MPSVTLQGISWETSSLSVDKEELYRSRQISEIWRYRNNDFTILILQDSSYIESDSQVLPGMTAATLTELISLGRRQLRTQWRQAVRSWARAHLPVLADESA
jgi:transposase